MNGQWWIFKFVKEGEVLKFSLEVIQWLADRAADTMFQVQILTFLKNTLQEAGPPY